MIAIDDEITIDVVYNPVCVVAIESLSRRETIRDVAAMAA